MARPIVPIRLPSRSAQPAWPTILSGIPFTWPRLAITPSLPSGMPMKCGPPAVAASLSLRIRSTSTELWLWYSLPTGTCWSAIATESIPIPASPAKSSSSARAAGSSANYRSILIPVELLDSISWLSATMLPDSPQWTTTPTRSPFGRLINQRLSIPTASRCRPGSTKSKAALVFCWVARLTAAQFA